MQDAVTAALSGSPAVGLKLCRCCPFWKCHGNDMGTSWDCPMAQWAKITGDFCLMESDSLLLVACSLSYKCLTQVRARPEWHKCNCWWNVHQPWWGLEERKQWCKHKVVVGGAGSSFLFSKSECEMEPLIRETEPHTDTCFSMCGWREKLIYRAVTSPHPFWCQGKGWQWGALLEVTVCCYFSV